eukprot:scaffold10946_cov114-Isochrysis_galbana.AAC.3
MRAATSRAPLAAAARAEARRPSPPPLSLLSCRRPSPPRPAARFLRPARRRLRRWRHPQAASSRARAAGAAALPPAPSGRAAARARRWRGARAGLWPPCASAPPAAPRGSTPRACPACAPPRGLPAQRRAPCARPQARSAGRRCRLSRGRPPVWRSAPRARPPAQWRALLSRAQEPSAGEASRQRARAATGSTASSPVSSRIAAPPSPLPKASCCRYFTARVPPERGSKSGRRGMQMRRPQCTGSEGGGGLRVGHSGSCHPLPLSWAEQQVCAWRASPAQPSAASRLETGRAALHCPSRAHPPAPMPCSCGEVRHQPMNCSCVRGMRAQPSPAQPSAALRIKPRRAAPRCFGSVACVACEPSPAQRSLAHQTAPRCPA